MRGPEADAGLPIPAEVIAELTDIAVRLADRGMDLRPTEAAAVATTQARALELLFHMGARVREYQRRVCVITMTGRFLPRGYAPGSGKMLPRPVQTIVLDADTLRLTERATTDHDHRALLPQLGASLDPVDPASVG
jgi:hypothetical protein